jgi:glycosyltransferase involved in cell wall biosynthesis
MKILFVCSGNSEGEPKTIVKNQGHSLAKLGIEIEYFTINDKGVYGYLQNRKKLKILLGLKKFNIIHAHYSLSGFISSLAGAKPIVVSLMGSDVYSIFPWNKLIKLFYWFYWDAVIVKSQEMKNQINLQNCTVIPNGVDITKFKPEDRTQAKIKLGFSLNKKYILFLSDPNRREKNYLLAKQAVDKLNEPQVELLIVNGIENDLIPQYLNAGDVLLLTSIWEGSVNVVKEAMACNISVVSTDVGDVSHNLRNLSGYYITSFDKDDIANKLNLALNYNKPLNGRQRIIELGLDSESIAKILITLYQSLNPKYNG